MGFFDLKAPCAVCEKDAGLNRYRIADKKWICPNCYKEAGFKLTTDTRKLTVEDVHAAIQDKKENEKELGVFTPTKKIGTLVEFDDNQKKWLVLSPVLGKREKSTVYNYSDIIDFELLEDGESVASGGLGRALVGGALFGGAGAIVGGVTGKKRTKGVCTSLKIKVTVNDMNNPAVYITFLSTKTKKDGFIYKSIFNHAQECLSTFQLICDRQKNETNNSSTSTSSADKIRKFKELLDEGIITQEEFDIKKKELLGI
ncbi:SHOCT domain-containing protein [Bacillus sp. JJ1562]|uniref:SHOCT domain-containing protein n=1 Tax=Bacillus sp. JJ1562 TaxID=3122960 RepID=UPI0030015D1E